MIVSHELAQAKRGEDADENGGKIARFMLAISQKQPSLNPKYFYKMDLLKYKGDRKNSFIEFKVQQNVDGVTRKYVESDNFSLMIFLSSEGSIDGFELTFDLPFQQRKVKHDLIWNQHAGLKFGTSTNVGNSYSKSFPKKPVSDLDIKKLVEGFLKHSQNLNDNIRNFVVTTLQNEPLKNEIRDLGNH